MDDMRPQGTPATDRQPGHETSDIRLPGLLAFTLGLLVVAAMIHFTLGAMMDGFATRHDQMASRRPPLFADVSGQFPDPQLQHDPGRDMGKFQVAEQGDLVGYGWVDRRAGIARIPIGRAMDLLARKGLPARGDRATAKGRARAGKKTSGL